MLHSKTLSASFKLVLITIFLGIAALAVRGINDNKDETAAAKAMPRPQYTAENRLILPDGYRNWVFVGASIGLSYSEETKGEGPGMFHHIYTQPDAYAHYRQTGKFPEKTMFVMEVYRPEQKVSPNKQGYFEGERVAIEISVKDREKFPEGWAYFNFGDGKKTEARPIPKSSCFDCHLQHGADDNVFVQFYPVLRDVKKTLKN